MKKSITPATYKMWSRKEKKTIILLSLLSVFTSLLVVSFALLSKWLIESIADNKYIPYIIALALIIILEVGVKMLYSFISGHSQVRLEKEMKESYFKELADSYYLDTNKKNNGEWLEIIISDSSVASRSILSFIPNICSTTSRILFAVAAMFYMDYRFAAILLVLGVAVFFLTKILRKRSKQYHKDVQEKSGDNLSFYQNSVASRYFFSLFPAPINYLALENKNNSALVKAKEKLLDFNIYINGGFLFFIRACYLFALLWCGLANANGVAAGSLLAMVQLISQIEGPFSSLSGILQNYYAGVGSLERLEECVDKNDKVINRDITSFKVLKGEDISFSYGNNKVISHYSFTIDRGSFTVIQSPSGSGKTTLIKLMMGLFTPSSGSITLDGVPVKECSKAFTYVPQVNIIFGKTIREYLTIFTEAEDKEIHKVLEVVQLKDKISSLEHGLDSYIDKENGLSEGEFQRLSIARALLAKRPILILDEATSSLDEVNETKLLEGLKNLGLTIIFITHKVKGKDYATQVLTDDWNKENEQFIYSV